MPENRDTWVLGIGEEIRSFENYKIISRFILLMSVIVFYFSNTNPNIPEYLKPISLFVAVFTFIFSISSKVNPNYLAYYLYQIGYELHDFEIETSYLKRNQQYVKNCNWQISHLSSNLKQTEQFFIGNTLDFMDNLYKIILRLNYLYSEAKKDISLIEKIDGMSSEPFTSERDFLSLKLKTLANLIRREHSRLTPEHLSFADRVSTELSSIQEKPFKNPIIEHLKGIWYKLPYKYPICGTITFIVFFIGFSQLLIYFKQEQAYSYALVASVTLTAFVLPRIEQMIIHDKGR